MTKSPPELGALGSRVLFSVSGRDYCVAEVVLAAAERGVWETARRMAGAVSRGSVDDRDLESAELSFRSARRLVAGDELRAWLAGWELSAAEWRGFLRRELLRERHSRPITPPADERTALVFVVCSGELGRWATSLAERLAVWRAAGHEPPYLPDDLGTLDDLFEDFVGRARSDRRALDRALTAHFLDWTRFSCESIVGLGDDVLSEIAACVRVDGRKLSSVAEQLCAPLEHRVLWLGESASGVRQVLLGARPGDLIGPIAWEGCPCVIAVIERIVPMLDDPEVSACARDEAVAGARRRMLDEWVVFRAID